MSNTNSYIKIHPKTEAVIALVLAGRSNGQISRELGIGVDAILNVIKRYGLVRPEVVVAPDETVHGLHRVNPKIGRAILPAGACWALLNAGGILEGTPYPGS